MNIVVIGLGRMGGAIAQRLIAAGNAVLGFDSDTAARVKAKKSGIACVDALGDISVQASVFWLMLPAGDPVDAALTELTSVLRPGAIVIDGGNSFYKDSLVRYKKLKARNVSFIDCGTSGGLHGKKIGYCLMVGGDAAAVKKVKPVFTAIAAPGGFAHVGPAGAGHYIKMVHNGIEYALLQSYAEGFQLLKNGAYKDLDLAAIANLWNHGSIIRSWILELAQSVLLHDQDFKKVSGSIGENLTGQWSAQIAKEYKVPAQMMEQALAVRAWSRKTGGNYATKLVALLRHEFGGHPVKVTKD